MESATCRLRVNVPEDSARTMTEELLVEPIKLPLPEIDHWYAANPGAL